MAMTRKARAGRGWRRLAAALALAASFAAGADLAIAAPDTAAPPLDPALQGPALDPAWPKRVYVMTDSVLLGAKANFFKSLPDWQVTYAGRPALMIYKALDEVRHTEGPLGPVAVVALGYNSLWEKDRKNFKRWSDLFDKSVEDMLAALEEKGARKVIWVLLRELTPDLLNGSSGAAMQYRLYAWYFPYVNERLKAIKARHPEMALADWPKAARQVGVTYDAIHLNPRGAELMVNVVKAAMGVDRPPARAATAVAALAPPAPAPAAPPPASVRTVLADPVGAATPARPAAAAEATAPVRRAEPEPARVEAAALVAPPRRLSHSAFREGMFDLTKLEFARVVMLGDSLTEQAQWSEIIGCPFVANRGVGADDSAAVLNRLDSVIRLAPAAVFLMIGANDVVAGVPTDAIVANVRRTLQRLAAVGAQVTITMVLPVAKSYPGDLNPKLAELNRAYQDLAKELGASVLDFRAEVQDEAGNLRDDLSVDGRHLSPAGYRVWRDAISPYVLENCATVVPRRDHEEAARALPVAVAIPVPAALPVAAAHPVAAAAALDPAPTGSVAPERAPPAHAGAWMIQVGAYPEEERAISRIQLARQLGGELLASTRPYTQKVVQGKFALYRARFAGLDQSAAENACHFFAERKIDCVAAPD